jgi:hypothetical protein
VKDVVPNDDEAAKHKLTRERMRARDDKDGSMTVEASDSSGLSRIRPIFWVFQQKYPFFGSNPFEFDSGAVKIGVMATQPREVADCSHRLAGDIFGVRRCIRESSMSPFSLDESRSTSILSLAGERFEVRRELILTAFNPDFRGQNGLSENHQGGKTGGVGMAGELTSLQSAQIAA